MKYEEWARETIGTQAAADLLGTTQRQIEGLLKSKKIQGVRIGPHSFAVYRLSVVRYFETKSNKGKSPSRKPKLLHKNLS